MIPFIKDKPKSAREDTEGFSIKNTKLFDCLRNYQSIRMEGVKHLDELQNRE